MKKGITFGAFEYVHIGHIRLFQQIKKHCDHLVVCVSNDSYIQKKKGHKPEFTLEERIAAIKSIKEVDEVDVQRLVGGKKYLVEKHKPDLIFVGDDWTPETFGGAGLGVKVIYLPRTESISSTKLRGGFKVKFKDLKLRKKQSLINDAKNFTYLMPDHSLHLQFGSLLGAVREKNVIGGDYDIDICYLSDFHTRPEVLKECEGLIKKFRDLGILNKYWTIHGGIGDTERINTPFGQIHVQSGELNVDLFASWIDENGDYWTCQWGNFGQADQFFPLVDSELGGVPFKIPNNADIILERLYGKDWHIPSNTHPSQRIERKCYLI